MRGDFCELDREWREEQFATARKEISRACGATRESSKVPAAQRGQINALFRVWMAESFQECTKRRQALGRLATTEFVQGLGEYVQKLQFRESRSSRSKEGGGSEAEGETEGAVGERKVCFMVRDEGRCKRGDDCQFAHSG